MTQGNEYQGEVETGASLEVLSGGVMGIGAVERATIDMQIATAKQYPRSVDKSLKEAMSLATRNEEVAGTMFYALPRSGKAIEGPSARLAEVMAYSWGNLRVDAEIVAEDATHITAMGTCFDLEKNVAYRVRVKRRITDRNGNKFNADMIGVTGNAAISIALRNSVFKVIPAALVQDIYGAARKASLGQGGTMQQKRQGVSDWFTKLGVNEEEIFKALGVNGWEDVLEDQLITLRGYVNSIKNGESDVQKIFRPEPPKKNTDAADELAKAAGGAGTERDEDPAAAKQAEADAKAEVAEDEAEAESDQQSEGAESTSAKDGAEVADGAGGDKAPSSLPDAPAKREDLLEDIDTLEKQLILKDGVLRKTRREHASDVDLANCDNESLATYFEHLLETFNKKEARKKK